jgi:aryl-alcohol dehydrogenase-like predicted oxidoreductase
MKENEKPEGLVSRRRVSRRTLLGGTVAAAGAAALTSLACSTPAPEEGAVASDPASQPQVPTRPFGSTGVEVPVVGLGGGSRFTDPIPDDGPAAELVKRAIELGVKYVETGANYGSSEQRIGLALKSHREGVFVETKIGARDYEGAMREMERSLELLQTDRIDLMLHHFLRQPEEIEQVMSADGADRAIREMVDQGAVRFRGFSSHSPELTLAAIDRLEPDAIQIPLNAVRFPDFEPDVLPVTESRDIAVIAMKTCGHGYFFHNNATHIDRLERFGPPTEAFEKPDLPSARDYLHYTLSLPVATAVVGMDSFFTVEEVVEVASEFAPLSAAEMASITERAQVFRTTGYWIPRA